MALRRGRGGCSRRAHRLLSAYTTVRPARRPNGVGGLVNEARGTRKVSDGGATGAGWGVAPPPPACASAVNGGGGGAAPDGPMGERTAPWGSGRPQAGRAATSRCRLRMDHRGRGEAWSKRQSSGRRAPRQGRPTLRTYRRSAGDPRFQPPCGSAAAMVRAAGRTTAAAERKAAPVPDGRDGKRRGRTARPPRVSVASTAAGGRAWRAVARRVTPPRWRPIVDTCRGEAPP